MTSVCHSALEPRRPLPGREQMSYRDRVATPQYHNLLDRLVREGRRTIEETCAAYEATARRMCEGATLSPRQLIRWMKGEVHRARPTAQRVAEAFWGHSFDSLLGPPEAFDRGPAQAHQVLQVRASRPILPTSAPVDHGQDCSDAIGDREVGRSSGVRRAVPASTKTTLNGGLEGLFARAAADAMEFTRRAEATDLGPQTIEHLELAVAGMASAFAYSPPAQMFRLAQAYRQRVAWFIDGKQTLRQRRELYRQAGWLSIILGWLSHDLGDPLAGEAHCLDAWEHGWQAEDGEICAWAMDTAATIAMYNNQPDRAREVVTKGLAHAPANSAAAVRLACQLTRAYGRLRQPDRLDDALADTRRQFEQLPDCGSGLFAVDVGRIASYAATSSI
jgi:hypothetical protein